MKLRAELTIAADHADGKAKTLLEDLNRTVQELLPEAPLVGRRYRRDWTRRWHRRGRGSDRRYESGPSGNKAAEQ